MVEFVKGKKHIELGCKDGVNFRKEYYGMDFQENDGGRAAAGYKGNTGDCVCRAISIASGLDYLKIYNHITDATKEWRLNSRARHAMKANPKNDTARTGVFKDVYHKFILSLGFKWIPTMKIGQGCKVHLRAGELPKGKLIVSVSRHLTSVIDGVINDTYDPSRNATRCVYGYYIKEAA